MEHCVKRTVCLWVDLLDLLRYREEKLTQNLLIIGSQDTDFGGLSNLVVLINC